MSREERTSHLHEFSPYKGEIMLTAVPPPAFDTHGNKRSIYSKY